MKQHPLSLVAAYKEGNRKRVNRRLNEQSVLLETQGMQSTLCLDVWRPPGAPSPHGGAVLEPGCRKEALGREKESNNRDNDDGEADASI